MAKFVIGNRTKTDVSVNKKGVAYAYQFVLPESARETIPYEECLEIEGRYTLSDYSDPLVGDHIVWKGHLWQVEKRVHFPYTPYSRSSKRVTLIYTRYLESWADDTDSL